MIKNYISSGVPVYRTCRKKYNILTSKVADNRVAGYSFCRRKEVKR